MNKRPEQGGALPLVIVATLIIVIIGVFFFFLVNLIGGKREFQNAVDSGNLNVAKQALIKRTTLPGGLASVQFAGLGPTDDSIDLNTFNRASAITAMVVSNARDMQTSGVALGSTTANTGQVTSAWASLGTSLANVLIAKNTFDQTQDFSRLSNSNSIRMLQNDHINDSEHTDHKTSFSDRSRLDGNESSSNVGFLASQLPSAPTSGGALFVSLNGQQYPKGYLPFDFNAGFSPVFFVPLKNSSSLERFQNSQPHHIAKKTFDTDAQSVPSWPSPVPNAFLSKAEAQEVQSKTQSVLNSCAISQSLAPSLGYRAQIPRGFIRIVNGSCSSGGNVPMPPTGSDIFSFLMNTPIVFGKPAGTTPLQAFYDFAPGANLDAIIAKNNAGQTPDAAKCNALHPPAPMDKCALIASKSAPINNSTPLSPAQKTYIADVFNLVIPGGGGGVAIAGCLHAAERANQEFLAIRADGTATARLNASRNFYTSGVANVQHGRGPFGGGCTSFVMTTPVKMSQVVPPESAIYAELVQRCRQINPDFNGNLDTVIGWNSLNVGLGATLYIYFDGSVNRATGAISGNLRLAADPPAFLTAVKDTPVDGRVLLHRIRTEPISNFSDINHAGDCGYPLPYDFYEGNAAQMCVRDRVEYTPCTGFRGLLGEVKMSTCFGNNGCPGSTTLSEGAGPATIECTVESSSFWEGPC
jgi:hypothetical protein